MKPILIIQAFPSGPYLTNAYLAICSITKKVCIIDPSPGSAPLIKDYIITHNLDPLSILLTHSHWDHIADVFEVKKSFSIHVAVHPLDLPNLERPGADGIPFSMEIVPVKADRVINDHEIIEVGECHLRVIYTPGHSIGSVCFYSSETEMVFTGDTLFRGAIGNLSFLTSRPDLMESSLARLKELPRETKVYPGHGSPTTIGREIDRGRI
jgi:hydroxyacylglutathione hydrolase